MVNLNKMYDGVVNSPETYLTQNLAADATIIYVADSSVFGSLPNLAVIGTDQNAETILIKSKRSDGGLEVQRALEGPAKRWEKTTAIARNFTNFDYQQIKDNIEKLNTGKQESLTAGDNIQITNGRISATDTKYDDTQIKKDITELQNNQLGKASKTEAESGVDNTKYMTPQTTKQAIEKLSPKQDLSEYLKTVNFSGTKLRTNKNNINVFTDRSTNEHRLDIILGDLELRTEENKKNIKTKLSELTDDENHRTVTDEEKQKLNNVKLSRAATFIIANYDSSENSKAGADYVIQENECAAEIINSFIAKLPEYGGKILLTEGNFNSKKNLAINFTKNNTIIEGYGDSTTIIDKLNKDERKNVIINISNGIVNCKLLNLTIIHETSNSINIRGSNNTIQNIKIKNNGTFSSVYINKNKNTLNNISIESTSQCYWIIENSNNNTLTNCTGTSTNGNAFVIRGSNNQLSNCLGTTTNNNAFYISGSGNSLIRCIGENSSKLQFSCFEIGGSNNTFTNCTGTSINGRAFSISDSNNTFTNCSGTTTNNNAFSIRGSQISVIGCFGESKTPNKYCDILFEDISSKCIGLGLQYRNRNGLRDKGTDNVLANNISIN